MRSLSLLLISIVLFIYTSIEATPLDPSSFNSLRLWLDTSTIAATDGTANSNGEAISAWNDKTTSGNTVADNLTQGSSNNRPSLAIDAFGSGIHGVKFARSGDNGADANNDFLKKISPSYSFDANDSYTIFMVYQFSSLTPSTMDLLALQGGENDSRPSILVDVRSSHRASARIRNDNTLGGSNAINIVDSVSQESGSTHIFTIRSDGVNFSLFLDGLLVDSGVPNQDWSSGPVSHTILGGANNGTINGTDGTIGSVLIFNDDLGTSNQTGVEQFLQAQFNLETVPEPNSLWLAFLIGCVLWKKRIGSHHQSKF